MHLWELPASMLLLPLLTRAWIVPSLPARRHTRALSMRIPDQDGTPASESKWIGALVDGQSKVIAGSIPSAPQPELMDYFKYHSKMSDKRPNLNPEVGRLSHWIAFERAQGNPKFVRDDLAHEQELKAFIQRDAAQAEMMMSAATVVGSGGSFVANVNQEWVARKAVELRVLGFMDNDRLRSDPVFGPFFEAAEVVGRDRKWRVLGGGELPPQATWRRNPVLRPSIKLLELFLFSVPGLALSRQRVVIDMLQLMAATYSTDFVDRALVALNAFEEDLRQTQ